MLTLTAKKRRLILKSALLFLLLVTNYSYIYPKTYLSYTDELIAKANRIKLYNDRYWRTLLHYKKKFFGIESLIDDPKFFISKNGKINPKSELEETIRSFFKSNTSSQKHPICKFIARYTWINKKLQIDESRLPDYECTEYNKYIEKLKPASISVVFPAGYIKSPASMYGHTFLIIESENGSRLLSHAVNYAAVTNESFGPFYAFKGLFGSYKGYYSILPYYEKVSEYSDMEKRDMWEYRLNLNRNEITRLIMHLKELHNVYSFYYFHDENCSYNPLFLLEAARPALHLTDQFPLFVAPLETIRLIKDKGLVKEPVYRPSKRTKINHLASKLTNDEQYMAIKIANGEKNPEYLKNQKIKAEKKALISDLASEYLSHRFEEENISEKEYNKNLLAILSFRSTLNINNNFIDIKTPPSPEKGHKSNRFSQGIGIRSNEIFLQLKYRPTYHSLMDVDDGFNEGSEIVFFDTSLRYYIKEKKIKLHKLDVIDVISIQPSDKFFTRGALKFKTGLQQKRTSAENENLAGYLNTGGGLAFDFPFIGRFYFLGEIDFEAAKKLENNVSFGPGGSIGLLNNVTSFYKYHLYFNAYYFALGEKHTQYETGIKQRLKITNMVNLLFNYSYQVSFDSGWHELLLKLNLFF